MVCCDERGLATFQLLRQAERAPGVPLRSLTPLELNGTNFRREFIEVRKATLASIPRKSRATGCA